ncbi:MULTISPECIES: peptide-methionine (S)-S-oxide reductase MsrA [Terrabacteria group]|uniref:peptide-methionine (S)-S-oxide reductase MsrA n=1 Tax=Bacillati TaxID=1783272 RepID=UPI001C6E7CD9|nr:MULTISPECIES: peptide-methionine (S)-S-oxide reductase MsrA [Terrabacteria group]MBW9212733.1 peptide-methionine (S)-S-oxide reductase MsrA [Trueperella sp. zg.1013]
MEKKIVMAGGCFWGVEKAFRLLNGIMDTKVGYVNGYGDNPSYQEVCTGLTGYKEAVELKYDSDEVDLNTILKAFFLFVCVEQENGQGNDIGDQYLPGVYYENEEDKSILEEYFALEKRKHNSFYVSIHKLEVFYPAEEYHQRYLEKNPRGYCHIPFGIYQKIEALNHH